MSSLLFFIMIKLDKRLSVCASLVERGVCVADVGTDHAYIPIWLIQNGICPRCVASDINKGPVERAERNVMLCGVSDKINVVCAPGLESEAFDDCDNIIIAGMGGELIASILGATDRAKKASRLILQPMTKQEILRAYLWDNGYEIIYDEPICADRLYQIISAKYTGVKAKYTEIDTLIGKHSDITEDVRALILFRLTSLKKSAEGISRSGGDLAHIYKLTEELEKLI